MYYSTTIAVQAVWEPFCVLSNCKEEDASLRLGYAGPARTTSNTLLHRRCVSAAYMLCHARSRWKLQPQRGCANRAHKLHPQVPIAFGVETCIYLIYQTTLGWQFGKDPEDICSGVHPGKEPPERRKRSRFGAALHSVCSLFHFRLTYSTTSHLWIAVARISSCGRSIM